MRACASSRRSRIDARPALARGHAAGAADRERWRRTKCGRCEKAGCRSTCETEPAGRDRRVQKLHRTWRARGNRSASLRSAGCGCRSVYYRVRVTKAGYMPLEVGAATGRTPVMLPRRDSDGAAGMVLRHRRTVLRSACGAGRRCPISGSTGTKSPTRSSRRSWMRADIASAKYWRAPFVRRRPHAAVRRGDDEIPRYDRTAGPSTWETGSFPEGQADFPVGGISWFEAAAYAVFAGKTLPTVYHWYPRGGRRRVFRRHPAGQQLRWQGPVPRGRTRRASAHRARATWPATSRSGA